MKLIYKFITVHRLVFVLFLLIHFVIFKSDAQTTPTSNTTYTFDLSGTFTIGPRTSVVISSLELWGAGGGGASGTGSGGGGGGSYIANTIPFTITNSGNTSQSITFTVGVGGAPGSNGGNSSITIGGNTYTAIGGNTGSGDTGGLGGSSTCSACTLIFAGGAGGSRSGSGGGGGGGSAFNSANGNIGGNGSGNTGGNGGTGTGNGGSGGNNNGSGSNGGAPGGGGGGRGNNGANSGTGANGQIIIQTGTVLPVVLTSFTAMTSEKTVQINWSTASEINNEKFIVETSNIGEVFQPLGEVAGAGTTTEPQNYSFTHHTPSAGINYYRLKQVDFDGTFEYSKVIAIEAAGSQDIFAFPNPARDKVTLQYDQSKGAGNIQLLDGLGRRIQARITGYAGNYELSLPESLARGTYWLKVERGGKVQTLPVVKE